MTEAARSRRRKDINRLVGTREDVGAGSQEAVAGSVSTVRYSIVVPVYKNEESIDRLLRTLEGVVAQLDGRAELVLVVDGSPDRSLERLQDLLPTFKLSAQVVSHSRNFGAFAAIRTGISQARGEYIGVVAADLQEPPELLLEFFKILSAGVADVVIGRRDRRDDPSSSAGASRLYWNLYRKFVLPEIPEGGVDVFGVNRVAAQELLRLNESSSSLIGQLFWVGFRRVEVPYHRQARQEGKSAWTLAKKLRYMSDSIFSFTSLPIRVLTAIGATGLALTVLLSIIVFSAWLAGAVGEPGYTPLMLVLLGCTFLLVLSLGIVGNYVWRTYENSKQRPVAIVSKVEDYGRGRGE